MTAKIFPFAVYPFVLVFSGIRDDVEGLLAVLTLHLLDNIVLREFRVFVAYDNGNPDVSEIRKIRQAMWTVQCWRVWCLSLQGFESNRQVDRPGAAVEGFGKLFFIR